MRIINIFLTASELGARLPVPARDPAYRNGARYRSPGLLRRPALGARYRSLACGPVGRLPTAKGR
jgi:hypothetical protein